MSAMIYGSYRSQEWRTYRQPKGRLLRACLQQEPSPGGGPSGQEPSGGLLRRAPSQLNILYPAYASMFPEAWNKDTHSKPHRFRVMRFFIACTCRHPAGCAACMSCDGKETHNGDLSYVNQNSQPQQRTVCRCLRCLSKRRKAER